jgi:hypothetical protein
MSSGIFSGMDKVNENRVRRMAERQGFALQKSRRRDPNAMDFGGYWIIDPNINGIIAPNDDFGFSLEAAEAFLTQEKPGRKLRPMHPVSRCAAGHLSRSTTSTPLSGKARCGHVLPGSEKVCRLPLTPID